MTEPKRQIETDKGSPDQASSTGAGGVSKSGNPKSSSNDVGAALRNAFRATVDEEIPNEMLDLLRRLD